MVYRVADDVVLQVRRIADELRDELHPGPFDGEWLARAATELEQFQKYAVDVFWNYHPGYYPKLPLCVQRIWDLGKQFNRTADHRIKESV